MSLAAWRVCSAAWSGFQPYDKGGLSPPGICVSCAPRRRARRPGLHALQPLLELPVRLLQLFKGFGLRVVVVCGLKPRLNTIDAPPHGAHVPLHLFQALGQVFPVGMALLSEDFLGHGERERLVLVPSSLLGRPVRIGLPNHVRPPTWAGPPWLPSPLNLAFSVASG